MDELLLMRKVDFSCVWCGRYGLSARMNLSVTIQFPPWKFAPQQELVRLLMRGCELASRDLEDSFKTFAGSHPIYYGTSHDFRPQVQYGTAQRHLIITLPSPPSIVPRPKTVTNQAF